MPFTPFHFGPGALIKAAFPRSFSFLTYCAAQVITDLESGYYLLRQEAHVHRWAHTLVGALGVAVLTTLFFGPVLRFARRLLAKKNLAVGWSWLVASDLSWKVIFGSALVGTVSHVLLDSIMHRDMQPFAPFSLANPLLRLVSLNLLHVVCLVCGLSALIYALVVGAKQR